MEWHAPTGVGWARGLQGGAGAWCPRCWPGVLSLCQGGSWLSQRSRELDSDPFLDSQGLKWYLAPQRMSAWLTVVTWWVALPHWDSASQLAPVWLFLEPSKPELYLLAALTDSAHAGEVQPPGQGQAEVVEAQRNPLPVLVPRTLCPQLPPAGDEGWWYSLGSPHRGGQGKDIQRSYRVAFAACHHCWPCGQMPPGPWGRG